MLSLRVSADLDKSRTARSDLSLSSEHAQLSVMAQSLRARLEGEGRPGSGLS
jgi:hypothetical protein